MKLFCYRKTLHWGCHTDIILQLNRGVPWLWRKYKSLHTNAWWGNSPQTGISTDFQLHCQKISRNHIHRKCPYQETGQKSSHLTQCDNTIWKRFKILIAFVCFIQSILQSKWTEEHFSCSFESLCNTWEKDTLFLGSPLFFHSGLLLFWPYYPQASHIHSW